MATSRPGVLASLNTKIDEFLVVFEVRLAFFALKNQFVFGFQKY